MAIRTKVAIIGAGAVGTSLAYALLIRKSAREVVLYDVNASKVEAEVLDLAHGTLFTNPSRVSGSSDIEVIRDAQVVVITAGAKQKPGQSRMDLAAVNVALLRDLMPRLVAVAPKAIYVLVTNPCDVMAYAAVKFSGLPTSQVFSSGTVLDSSRLRWLLAETTGVATASVHAMIIGEHGDSEFALWSQASIGPVPLAEWNLPNREPTSATELKALADDVKNAAYKVIQGKGATNYAIGLSGARIVEAVLRDENAILPVSSVLKNYKGISDVALSVPSIVGAAGVTKVIDVPMTADEQRQLQESADAIKQTLKLLGLN